MVQLLIKVTITALLYSTGASCPTMLQQTVWYNFPQKNSRYTSVYHVLNQKRPTVVHLHILGNAARLTAVVAGKVRLRQHYESTTSRRSTTILHSYPLNSATVGNI